MILGEIVRSYLNKGKLPRVYYWRTSNGEEVDFIIEDRSKILPVEIKMTSNITLEMTKNLTSFLKQHSDRAEKGILVYLGKEEMQIAKNIFLMSYNKFFNYLYH